MRIGVTGASGYLGSHVARTLAAVGHKVVPLTRASGFRLGEPFTLPRLDALVHAAYDFTTRSAAEVDRVNVGGSVALFHSALAQGVQAFVFVSSMAAFPGCRSLYGQGKLAVEDVVLREGGYVIRPGTVHGDGSGGIFRILETVARLPIIPLPGAGRQLLYLIHISDLCIFVERLLAERWLGPPRLFQVAHPEAVSLRQILTCLAPRRPLYLPLPEKIALGTLRMAEVVFGAACPVRSDSLVSLLNPNPAPDWQLPVQFQFRPFASLSGVLRKPAK